MIQEIKKLEKKIASQWEIIARSEKPNAAKEIEKFATEKENIHAACAKIILSVPVHSLEGLQATYCRSVLCIGTGYHNCTWICTSALGNTKHCIPVDNTVYAGSECSLGVLRKIVPEIEHELSIIKTRTFMRGTSDDDKSSRKALRILRFVRRENCEEDLDNIINECGKDVGQIMTRIINFPQGKPINHNGWVDIGGTYDLQVSIWKILRNDLVNNIPMQCTACAIHRALQKASIDNDNGLLDEMNKYWKLKWSTLNKLKESIPQIKNFAI